MNKIIEDAVENHYKEKLYRVIGELRAAIVSGKGKNSLADTIQRLYARFDDVKKGIEQLTDPQEIELVPKGLVTSYRLVYSLAKDTGAENLDKLATMMEYVKASQIPKEKINAVSKERIDKKVNDMKELLPEDLKQAAEELFCKIGSSYIKGEIAINALELLHGSGDIGMYFSILSAVSEEELNDKVDKIGLEYIGVHSVICAAKNAAMRPAEYKENLTLHDIIKGFEEKGKEFHPELF